MPENPSSRSRNPSKRVNRIWCDVAVLLATPFLVGFTHCLAVAHTPFNELFRTMYRTFFRYDGKVGYVTGQKNDGEAKPPDKAYCPDGKEIPITDPRSPLEFGPDGSPRLKRGASLKPGGPRPGPPVPGVPQTVEPPDSFYILDIAAANRILAYDTRTMLFQREYPLPTTGFNTPGGIDLSRDGATLWATIREIPENDFGFEPEPPFVVAVDVLSGQTVRRFDLPSGTNPGEPVLSNDSRTLYIPDAGGFAPGTTELVGSEVLAVDTETGEIVARMESQSQFTSIRLLTQTPDGALLFVSDNGLSVFETLENSLVYRTTSIRPSDADGGMLVDPFGSVLYVISGSRILIVDVVTGELLRSATIQAVKPSPRFTHLTLSADGGLSS